MASTSDQSANAETAELHKKLDTRDFHAVHAEALRVVDEMLNTVSSHSVRFFGNTGGYAKAYGLPAEAPKKKEFTSVKKAIRGLKKEFTKKYNSVTTKDRRDADGKPRVTRTGMSRLVLCSEPLTKFFKLADWNLMSESDPGRAYCVHGKITCAFAGYIKLNMLQRPDDAQYWRADKAIIDVFGLEQFKRKGVDPEYVRYIDIQKLLSGDKENPKGFPGHLLSIKKGTLDPELEAEVRRKCASESLDEFGGAVDTVHSLRQSLKGITDLYVKRVKNRDAARETRPGQEITRLWEGEVSGTEAEYAKKAVEIRKRAESYNFSIAESFPPKLALPIPRAKKPKAATTKASTPATRAATK